MTTRITLTSMLLAAVAPLCAAEETLSIAAPAPAEATTTLDTYTAPLEVMFGIVEKINAHLASVTDEETAELAGAAIQELLRPLNTQAETFSQLPAPTPEVQAELDAWAPFCSAYLVECMDAALVAQLQFPHPWMLSGRMPGRILHDMVQTCRPDGVDIDSCVDCADTMACMRAIA